MYSTGTTVHQMIYYGTGTCIPVSNMIHVHVPVHYNFLVVQVVPVLVVVYTGIKRIGVQ
jgi:hypothetical protein